MTVNGVSIDLTAIRHSKYGGSIDALKEDKLIGVPLQIEVIGTECGLKKSVADGVCAGRAANN